jgi:type II secretory ATPase GspE/PulE/Tfp pilus assembly ATPase PilB-like protein
MEELKGISAMASVASSLTLHSVLATLHTAKRPEETARDIAYNEGVQAAINVIEVYRMVLNGELTSREKEGKSNG